MTQAETRLVFEAETGILGMENLYWVQIDGAIVGQVHANPTVATAIDTLLKVGAGR